MTSLRSQETGFWQASDTASCQSLSHVSHSYILYKCNTEIVQRRGIYFAVAVRCPFTTKAVPIWAAAHFLIPVPLTNHLDSVRLSIGACLKCGELSAWLNALKEEGRVKCPAKTMSHVVMFCKQSYHGLPMTYHVGYK